jgi:hypothetical protein
LDALSRAQKEEKKMHQRIFLFFVLVVFVGFSAGISSADRRGYVWTYEYLSMPKGEAEIEYYQTLEYADVNKPADSKWKHWVEFEYGLTDNWDISLYQQFAQTNTAASKSLSYDGYKIRTRYRFAQKDQLPLDILFYLEYIGKNDLSSLPQGEAKLILAKDVGRINFAYNQIYKVNLDLGGASENEYSSGISYEFNPRFKAGFEFKGNMTSGKHYFGPTVSWAQEKFWIALGTIRGSTSKADNIQTRMLVGIHL